MAIVTLQPWHLIRVAMLARQQDAEEFGTFSVDDDPQIWACRQALKPGLMFSVTDTAGAPVACFGFTHECKGIATAWLIATETWRVYVKSMVRAFNHIWSSGEYFRLQALVRPDRPAAVKFIEWLGFRLDGVCPKISPNGATMLFYSKT